MVNAGQVLSLSDRVTIDLHDVVSKVKRLGEFGSELSDDACLACLHCGDLLPGWYDDWVFLEQQRLRNVRLRAFLMLARRWIDEDDVHKAVEAAESALELEPLHESAVALLINAELKAGNRARALRTFQAFRTNLGVELGIEPSEHLARVCCGYQFEQNVESTDHKKAHCSSTGASLRRRRHRFIPKETNDARTGFSQKLPDSGLAWRQIVSVSQITDRGRGQIGMVARPTYDGKRGRGTRRVIMAAKRALCMSARTSRS